ncbi:FAS1 domain-containing protein [Crepidotus variabilis]|uniref:FAS1 domain-containing protein n=1 Tax=Crepidotus variabilis TaxID=179855 RepID=A0A9P6JUL6_9AGAR|nr:FAS1 domain-containing protein [Crepidotus variabilis]
MVYFWKPSTSPLSLLLLSSCVTAASVQDVISQRSELSMLNTLVNRFPNTLNQLNQGGGTLLAPSNTAISKLLLSAGIQDITTVPESTVQDLMSYHILNLTLQSADLRKKGGVTVDTTLLKDQYANLGGRPNVIFSSAFGSVGEAPTATALNIYSGVGDPANVTTTDIGFDRGFVHVIDSVLNLPIPCTQTAKAASLSTLLNALMVANLTSFVDTTPKFTCFAPTDAAFQEAGINISALTNDQVVDALKYHSIVGDVGYSTAFEDGQQYQTLLGVPVTITKRDGSLFINDVAVLQGNVMMSNGVAHVLSGVLSPVTAPKATQTVVVKTTPGSPSASSKPDAQSAQTTSSATSIAIPNMKIFFAIMIGLVSGITILIL